MRLPLRNYEKQLLKTAIDYVNDRIDKPIKEGNLADWFDRIARSVTERKALVAELNEVLQQEDIVRLAPQLREVRGRLRLEYVLDGNPYEGRSWAVIATALILDERYGLTNRLKRCGNPDCRKFKLDLNPHGRPRRNCNKTCQRKAEAAASAERSRRRREKAKRQKRGK